MVSVRGFVFTIIGMIGSSVMLGTPYWENKVILCGILLLFSIIGLVLTIIDARKL